MSDHNAAAVEAAAAHSSRLHDAVAILEALEAQLFNLNDMPRTTDSLDVKFDSLKRVARSARQSVEGYLEAMDPYFSR